MPSDHEQTYGHSTSWQPERARLKVFPLLVVVRHGRCPDGCRLGPARRRHQELLGRARHRGDRGGAERRHPTGARGPAVAAHARARLPPRVDRGRSHPRDRRRPERDRRGVRRRQLRLGPPCRVHRRCRERRARRPPRLGQHVVHPNIASDREAPGHHREHRRPRDRLSRDRRPCKARAPARDARWQRPQHGPLGARDALTRRMGDRSLLADRRQPGGHPPGLERGHLRLSLGGEGDGDDDDVLRPARLRGTRAPTRDGHRTAHRRWREPREPAFRRGGSGHPHRQPDGRGEENQPRLPGVLRQRRQRDTHASSCSGGRSYSSGSQRSARSAATCIRAATEVASTR